MLLLLYARFLYFFDELRFLVVPLLVFATCLPELNLSI